MCTIKCSFCSKSVDVPEHVHDIFMTPIDQTTTSQDDVDLIKSWLLDWVIFDNKPNSDRDRDRDIACPSCFNT